MKQSVFAKENLKRDFPAGLVVFLVALPLCIGIAVGSGAPPFAGLITGIVGGILVSQLSGSQLSVSGPAAGLTMIVFAAIQKLGYEQFLISVVLGGMMQLALGYLRAGTIALYFPSSVIKGMLAAIGILLIFKEIPHAFGLDSDFMGDLEFSQTDGKNTLTELLELLEKFRIEVMITSAICFAVYLGWDKYIGKKMPILPAALITVLVSVLLTYIFEWFAPEYIIANEHMVQVPVTKTFGDFVSLFNIPDFSGLTNPEVWITAITLAIVASLETLLSVEAIDKLDPQKRVTPTNRELKAQGAGNMVSGLLGGLPMTAVIVRGSTNVNAGAKTKMSAFIHGVLLLLSVLLIPGFLNRIPLAALAVILIIIGYKLTKPALYRSMYQAGWNQFIPFVVTVLAIYFSNLLWGIGIGLAVAVVFLLRQNMRNNFRYNIHTTESGRQETHIRLAQEMSFLNKASVRLALDELPEDQRVVIDGRACTYIDYDVLEIIYEFTNNAPSKNIEVVLEGIPSMQKITNH